MNHIGWETGPRYRLSGGIQLPGLLKRWGSLGNKMLSGRVSELNLGECLKCVVNAMRWMFCIREIYRWEEKGLYRKNVNNWFNVVMIVSWWILV